MLPQNLIKIVEEFAIPHLNGLIPANDPKTEKRYRIMFGGQQLICYGRNEWNRLTGAKLALRRQLVYSMRHEVFTINWLAHQRGYEFFLKATGEKLTGDEYKDLEKAMLKYIYENVVTIEEFT